MHARDMLQWRESEISKQSRLATQQRPGEQLTAINLAFARFIALCTESAVLTDFGPSALVYAPHMETDVLIIGAGPIGLETAAAAEAAGLRAEVVDAGALGQTIATQFPTATRFFSSPERLEIAGISIPLPTQDKPTGEDYLAYLRSVVLTLDLRVHTFQRVVSCTPSASSFHVDTVDKCGLQRTWTAAHVVLATGGTQRCRTLGIEGESLPHVSQFLGDPHRFFNRRVLVVGGRNSAVESALRIHRVGGEAMLSYRGETMHKRVKYWLRPEVEALIEEGRIVGLLGTVVERISPEHVELRHLRTDKVELLLADDVLLQLGFEQDSSILQLFGVQVDPITQAPTFDIDTMMTNVPGVFVAGTASAGTQARFKVYIETSHVHAARIVAAMCGDDVPPTPPARVLPEN